VTTQQELYDAVQHIGTVTGDPRAWTRGLTQADTAVVGLAVAPEAEVTSVLAKIRANHPTLFDPRTGAPITPTSTPPTGEPQRGAGITAIQKAESDLAQQNSATAQVDLLVITAILNAHTTTEHGNAELRRLQSEIEESVRVRTDLDTPAGARDFQRYLIGKLREIGSVVQSASLDDRSKAVLASAWTALYESSKSSDTVAPDRPAATTTVAAAEPEPPLLPYGADLGPDPLLEQLLSREGPPATVPAAQPASAGAAPAVPLGAPGLPALGTPGGGGLGAFGGAPPSAGTGWGRTEDDPPLPTPRESGEPTLDELLADAESALEEQDTAVEDVPEHGDEEGTEPEDDEVPAEAEPPESAQVRLPNGDVITAANPQLAKVITTALGGTPVGEAFHRHGLTIPPPGTPVAQPVDPAEVTTGDVGMFTDRQALALDRTRALLGGQIEPLASVSGPSFLGWIHPPPATFTAPAAAASAPLAADSPAPTRPATTPVT
jgi:hypothetical protein